MLVKKISIIVFILIFFIVPFSFQGKRALSFPSFSPQQVFADDTSVNGSDPSGISIRLVNPLGTTDSIPGFVRKLLEVVMKIGVPLVAIMFIYTGYLFVTAQGNEKKLEEAKRALVYVFIGAVILLGAYVIAQAIQGTVNAIKG